jgi:peptidoglycan/LPS O-acetylase OafA/YrhL
MPPGGSHRFAVLDGIRGLAAISVMLYHFGWDWFHGAWVAVDLFFVLSGFVITHSYADRIAGGMGFRDFARARLIRLGPVYVFGLLLGTAGALLHGFHVPGTTPTGHHIFTAAVLGLLVFPYFNRYAWPAGPVTFPGPVYPLNSPAWSLFFELFVNGVFYVVVAARRRPPGMLIVALSALAFAFCTLAFDAVHAGWSSANFFFGFPRVMAGFFLGAFAYALHARFPRLPRALPIILFAALIYVASLPNLLTVLLATLVLAPAIILAGATIEVDGRLRDLCNWLGSISYPLYLIHIPAYQIAYELFDFRNVSPWIPATAIGVFVLALSALIKNLDLPLRRYLQARFARAAIATTG